MNKTIFFDLDNCLFHTQSMKPGLAPIFTQILKKYVHSEECIKDYIDVLWTLPFDEAVTACGLGGETAKELLNMYPHLPIPETTSQYKDVYPALTFLRDKQVQMFLISKGFHDFQTRKVKFLGIESFFEKIIFVNEDSPLKDKLSAFRSIASDFLIDVTDLYIVGDSSDELTAGKEIGATTVQTLRDGVTEKNADYHIQGLAELPSILRL